MTKLRGEFQKIVDSIAFDLGWKIGGGNLYNGLVMLAQGIQEYIDAKKPVMLTDDEICAARHTVDHTHVGGFPYTRAIIAAHIAKQKQPQKRTVTVRVYTNKRGAVCIRLPEEAEPPCMELKATQEIEFEV